MASTRVKSTYSLDVGTVHALEDVARRWRVSKSEALRRAIEGAALLPGPGAEESLAALGALQRSLAGSGTPLPAWERRVRAERRAAGKRLAPR